MKINKILLLFMSTILLSACKDGKPIIENKLAEQYLNQDFYIVGSGECFNGANWEKESGTKFIEAEKEDKSIYQTYIIDEANLHIGDSFKIINKENFVFPIDNYLLDEGSFVSNNIKLDDIDSSRYIFDCLYTGTYDFSLNLYLNGKVEVKIHNGENTIANDNVSFNGNKTIDFYANGDLHGMSFKTKEGSKTYPSIASYIGYAKSQIDKTGKDNSLLLSNGDLWQGSLASNSNYGMMMNEIFDKAGYETFTFGNHEFDWGDIKIKENQSYTTNMEFLAANIVYRNSTTLVDYASPYKIIEKSGVKIGIIGVIGENQITSITSTYVQDVDFLKNTEIVKKYSDKLRTVFNCDIVVASFHEGTSSVQMKVSNHLSKISPVSNRRYIDGAFSAHDHVYANKISNGVPILNSGNNGRFLSHFSLNINNGVVSCTKRENLGNSSTSNYSYIYEYEEDKETLEIVNRYYTEEIKTKGESVVGHLENTFSSNGTASHLMAKAMFETIEKTGYDIDVAIVNQGRQDLQAGDLTYYDLLSCFPFFNKTIVFKTKGVDLIRGSYKNYSDQPFDVVSDKEYVVATYDYIAFHQNQYREYDKFINREIIFEYGIYPVDLLAAYMKENGPNFISEDYEGRNFNFI